MVTTDGELYEKAQIAMISLKSAVFTLLTRQGVNGLLNSEVGRTLGIHGTPNGRQEGWVSAYILQWLESEGRVHRIKPRGRWVTTD